MNINLMKAFTDLIEKWDEEVFKYRHPDSFANELREAVEKHQRVCHDWAKEEIRLRKRIRDLEDND